VRYAVGLAFLLIAVAMTFLVARWIEENYVPRPDIALPTGPFHNPGYRHTAENAVRQFSNLSAVEQAEIRKNLEENTISVTRWLEGVRESGVKILCLGEDHEDATRQFLARTLFSELEIDVLLLEVTPRGLERINQELRWARERVSLLGADIAEIIRAARNRNPDLQVIGIEETKAQRMVRQMPDSRGTRDESIHSNLWEVFRYGSRHAILFGALHCTSRDQWLYGRIRRLAPGRIANEMLNIRVIEEHQEGPVEAFVFFLGEIGIPRGDFVVVDSQAVHPLVRKWFDLLGVMLEDFAVLMVFRNRPQVSNG
jgi:hypothetical protein